MTTERSTTTNATATAERVLDLVRASAAGAEAEVTVRRGNSALTRFANSFIHQNVAEEITEVRLRVALDGRVAASSLDAAPDDDALRRLVDNALAAARVRPVDPDWPGLAPAAPAPDVDHWDEATANASPDDRARRVRDFVDAAGGLETAGSCSTAGIETVFANSAGQHLAGRASFASLDGIARTASSDGSGRHEAVSLAPLDGRVVGERAARKARDAADPTDLEPGRYEVVLEPQCVANLLQFLFVHGFNGRAVEDGRSFVRLGEPQFDLGITIREDVTDPGQVGVGFDSEGTPHRSVDLVQAGVTRSVLHTRRTARQVGTESTGSAIWGADTWGALPSNVVLEPGDRSPEELVRSVGRGLLVTDFWYTRILDPRTQVVTGLTRNGVWLVEHGAVVRPVRNLRFTQSFHEALGPDRVLGVGSDASLIAGGFDGAYLVPSLHLASWNFTGGARG